MPKFHRVEKAAFDGRTLPHTGNGDGTIAASETIEISADLGKVTFRGKSAFLAPLPTKLLAALNRRPDRAGNAESLCDILWGHLLEPPDDVQLALRQLVMRARRQLKRAGVPLEIRNRWAFGYYLSAE